MRYTSINNVLADKISGEWGVEPEDDCGVKIIRTANFTNLGVIDFSKIVLRKIETKKIEQKKLISGDVIIEKSGGSPTQPVGRVVYFENLDNSIYLCNNFTTVLRPNKSIVFPKYLFNILFYNHLTKKTLRFQNKTTGIINLKLDNYLKSEIPLPPLDDQIRIATVLTRAEKLIAKRKESIKALDELLKSTFLEMFGDVISSHGKAYSLDDLKRDGKGTFSNGPFGSDLLTSELNSENGIPVIYIRDIRNGYLDWKSNVFVTPQKASSLPNCNVNPGDLLIAKVGDPPGIAAVCNENLKTAIITQDVIRLRLNTRIVSPVYLWYFINSDLGKRLIKRITIKGTRSRFPLGDFKKLQLKIPDINLQNQFADIVEKVLSLKSKHTNSLTELENLYGSVSQRAFKGELDLSGVPVETEKQVIELHGEVKGTSSVTGELSVLKIYSEAELLKIIQSQAEKTFSFDSLMTELEKASFEEMPKYEELKEQIYKMLEGTNPLLSQTFDKVKKEIVLRVNI